ncbi:MAG TPA: TadE/TadG family type IV pilus assembly protein [Candidatus Acidoferrum sp.]|nr:TadE/TadG family type IV pilus assembly protein [Candidatus Acidoferrum sp.]
MVRTRRARGGSQRGQALLEIALVTPLLLALALGVIELGRYAYIAILVGSAAHAGAMYGAQGPTYAVDTTGIQDAADNDFQNNGQDVGELNIQPSTVCACDNRGSTSMETNRCSTRANGNIDQTINRCSTTGGHWVSMVSVEATGTFRSLFNYPGIPRNLSVDRTATVRVGE